MKNVRQSMTELLVTELAAEVQRLKSVLGYVADMTYCGTDAEWHFKLGYDPQRVLDAVMGPREDDESKDAYVDIPPVVGYDL